MTQRKISPQMYRPEIDGLRAIAVIPVILFHAGYEFFSGGFLGVDVFFVISGYLITGIIINEISNNQFSIAQFYERRARRILPALFFMMLVCIPFSWLLMLPKQFTEFAHSLVAVSLFLSNFLFWQESGYFAAEAELKPLLHTWSLAVEEQYYLFFPIFLTLFWPQGRQRVFWVIIFITLTSFVVSEWMAKVHPATSFYLSPSRAWELLIGSISAFLISKYGIRNKPLLSLLGLSAIVIPIFIYDKDTPFPGVYALPPTIGVVLILLFSDRKSLVTSLLSNRFLVGIGLISYSAYLWHQPLFAFARLYMLDHPSAPSMFLLCLLSLMIAFLSWKYIEQPFRDRNKLSRKLIFSLSTCFMLFFILTGLTIHFFAENLETYWLSKQKAEKVRIYNLVKSASVVDKNYSKEFHIDSITDCRFNVENLNKKIKEKLSLCNIQHGPGVLILGDSHAIDLYGMVTARFDLPFLVGLTQGGCRPHTNRRHCQYNKLLTFIENNPTLFSHIIYEQAGFYLLKQENGRKGSREMFRDLPLNAGVNRIIPDEEHILSTLDYLVKINSHVPTTWFLPRVEHHISQNHIFNFGCNHNWTLRDNLQETFYELDEKIIAISKNINGVTPELVSQNKILNLDFQKDFMNCNELFWSDGDHFSKHGEIRFSKRLPETFIKIMTNNNK